MGIQVGDSVILTFGKIGCVPRRDTVRKVTPTGKFRIVGNDYLLFKYVTDDRYLAKDGTVAHIYTKDNFEKMLNEYKESSRKTKEREEKEIKDRLELDKIRSLRIENTKKIVGEPNYLIQKEMPHGGRYVVVQIPKKDSDAFAIVTLRFDGKTEECENQNFIGWSAMWITSDNSGFSNTYGTKENGTQDEIMWDLLDRVFHSVH